MYCAVGGEMETAGASVGEQRSMPPPRLVTAAALPNPEQFDSDSPLVKWGGVEDAFS